MKQKIKKIYNEYLEEGKNYYKVAKEFFLDYKNIWPKIKKSLKNPDNRKKYITAVLILIIFNTIFISQLFSFGYYYDVAEFPIAYNKIGNIYLNDNDYILFVYLETDNNEYKLVEDIPEKGYTYSGYKCEKGSTLIFDEQLKETSVDLTKKDSCSIYFDINDNNNIDIMLEKEKNSNNFIKSEIIPFYGYYYDHYYCDNESTLNYDVNLHNVISTQNNNEKCQLYFKKLDVNNIQMKLFVEKDDLNDFVEVEEIPKNTSYTLNSEKSYCNFNNERRDGILSYNEGFININDNNITDCTVYLNKYE